MWQEWASENGSELQGFALGRLRYACTRAVHHLVERYRYRIDLLSLVWRTDFTRTITRAELEEIKLLRLVAHVLQDAGVPKHRVKALVLLGESWDWYYARGLPQAIDDFFVEGDEREPEAGEGEDPAPGHRNCAGMLSLSTLTMFEMSQPGHGVLAAGCELDGMEIAGVLQL